MSELNDKLLEIKRQKDEYIIPENLKKRCNYIWCNRNIRK